MLPTAAPPTLMTGTPPVDKAMPNGPKSPENGEFKAVLAKKAADVPGSAEIGTERVLSPEAAAAPDAELPESGKDLPDAREASVAELPTAAILALLPAPVTTADPTAQPAPDQPVAPAPALNTIGSEPDQPRPRPAPGKIPVEPASPELQQLPPVPAETLLPVAVLRDAPRQAPPPRVAATLRLLAEAAPDKGTSTVPELPPTPSSPAAPGPSLPFVSVPAAAPANAPVTLPTALQAGHDFAQMMERLATARESTQPHAATIALAHAEFGPVELRFASDANGLSVAIASADPDFARAVQAAVPPVQASSDSNATQGRHAGQSGSQPESFASRQHGQNAARREPQSRFSANNSAPRSTDSSADDSSIFA